ncbi:Transcription elongation factor B (SIII), polypeptide 1 (15kDa, elongin C) [Actinomortierella ambigua]|uniref:Elongin-C n=1 Tax=Actinomortierella ambigua TaxID=1343610 RepID=A0A9P6U2E3_9FUNG|nr:Transcription elongation factor B (SIII), polypeptide 1 (15kDa, elongin C) [Actinomortierella ambigua]KAG0256689.1 Transcription elongation factor B (SIII), polypeptide 1 (15kDa, elongin C) [Actinomortierella ambigua]
MSANTVDEQEYVTLESAEGFHFVVHRMAAMLSGTVRSMLSSPGQFTESTENIIRFREIKAVILEKVIQYWYYKARYMNSVAEIPHFEIEPEYALETLMAADFLNT